MMNFYFKTAAGHVFVGVGKDVDRARSDAKRKAGSLWSPSAKCFKVGNALNGVPDRKEMFQKCLLFSLPPL